MKRVLILVVSLLAVSGLVATAQAQNGLVAKRAENPVEADRVYQGGASVRTLPSPIVVGSQPQRAAGTIQYDDGVVTALPGTSSLCWGNQFDTSNGNPLTASGSVSQLSWFMFTGAGTDNVFISLFDQQSGTGANLLTSVSVPATVSGGFNTAALAIPYVGNTFLAGVWYVAGDTVGLGSGTTGGQGDHLMAINDLVATGFTTFTGFNALVRASGNIVVPVELMDFQVVGD